MPDRMCNKCAELAVMNIYVGYFRTYELCLSCLRAFSIEVADRLEAAEKVNDEVERAER